jgi:alkylation response protein AidB-like acyl-CoA dehydrogenase
MNFGLTDEQLLMQDTVRALLADQCPPLTVIEQIDAGAGSDPNMWGQLVDMGLVSLFIPEEFGGAGLSLLDAALIAEVSGEGLLNGPLFGHQLATLAILTGGSDDQRAEFLPSLASGARLGTVALAEPGDRWEADSWTTSESSGLLSGYKVHVPNATTADLFVVGLGDGGLALIEAGAANAAVTTFDGVDRTRPLGELTLDDASAVLLPNGAEAMSKVRDLGLVMLAADAFGCAARLIRETVDYLGEREQFGTKLTQFQGVKHELANHSVSLEPTRALWWYAAHALESIPDEAPRVSAMAKASICDKALVIARACVDLHGAMGFTWESPVHLWYKRILFDRAFLGGSTHHLDRAAALSNW